jgi:uncharacterized protein (DUF1697 family)
MADLKEMCVALGFDGVRTYIASGNVVFSTGLSEAEVKKALEERLRAYAGKPVGVMVRTAREMADVLSANPFPDDPGNRTVALFLDAPPPADTLDTVRNRLDERREIYIAYGSGMGTSKLAIPAGAPGTARNMNTVAKLAELSRSLA